MCEFTFFTSSKIQHGFLNIQTKPSNRDGRNLTMKFRLFTAKGNEKNMPQCLESHYCHGLPCIKYNTTHKTTVINI